MKGASFEISGIALIIQNKAEFSFECIWHCNIVCTGWAKSLQKLIKVKKAIYNNARMASRTKTRWRQGAFASATVSSCVQLLTPVHWHGLNKIFLLTVCNLWPFCAAWRSFSEFAPTATTQTAACIHTSLSVCAIRITAHRLQLIRKV